MKDYSLVGIVLGIVAILGIGICEQVYLNDIAINMKKEVLETEQVVYSGDVELGIEKLQKLLTKWEKDKKILESIINHQDIRRISEGLIEIDNKLKDFSNSDNISANFALLREYIIGIKKGNEFTISNIL